jgi:hypothetical protein
MFSNWRRHLGQQATIQDKYAPARQTLAELFDCPHCLGVWIAGLVYLLRKPLRPLWMIFGMAGLQSLLQSFDDRMNEE